jgi:hypothetical protein
LALTIGKDGFVAMAQHLPLRAGERSIHDNNRFLTEIVCLGLLTAINVPSEITELLP